MLLRRETMSAMDMTPIPFDVLGPFQTTRIAAAKPVPGSGTARVLARRFSPARSSTIAVIVLVIPLPLPRRHHRFRRGDAVRVVKIVLCV